MNMLMEMDSYFFQMVTITKDSLKQENFTEKESIIELISIKFMKDTFNMENMLVLPKIDDF